MKIGTILGVAVVAAAAIAGVASARTTNIYYDVVFYSDATYTEVVGGYRQYCLSNTTIMTPQVTGEFSSYEIATPIGNCPGLGDW
jgi:hypothetical protein